MSRTIVRPENYEDSVTQLFKPFLQKPVTQVSDDEYHQTITLFLETVLKLDSHDVLWARDEDSESFCNIFIVFIYRFFEQKNLNNTQIDQIISWMIDQRFMLMLTLLIKWNESPDVQRQLNKVIHESYTRDKAQRDIIDHHIATTFTILHQRLIAGYAENSFFYRDIIGLLGRKNKKEAERLLSFIHINLIKFSDLFRWLGNRPRDTMLIITEDEFSTFCLERESVMNAHSAISRFAIGDLNAPCKRVITFIMSVRGEEEALTTQQLLETLLWKKPLIGMNEVITANKLEWTNAFLRELLATLYFLVISPQLPQPVLNELHVTFEGAPEDNFIARLNEFRQDDSFKKLFIELLKLVSQGQLGNFDAAITELAAILRDRQSLTGLPQNVEKMPDEEILAAISEWRITSEPVETLTTVMHRGINLTNLGFCDIKQKEIQSVLEEEAKQNIQSSLEAKVVSKEALTQEEVLYQNKGELSPTAKYDLARQAREESLAQYSLRRKTTVYHIGNEISLAAQIQDPDLLEVSQLYLNIEQETTDSLLEKNKRQAAVELEQTRRRDDSFRQAGMDEGVRAGIQAGIEEHKRIVKSRLTKIAFGLLTAVGVGLLIYLTVQTCGVVPAAIAIGIALKPFWIAGGVTAGIGSFGWIGKYAKDRGWFAQKSPRPPRVTQQARVTATETVTAAHLDMSIQSSLSSKKTDSLKSNQSNDSAVSRDAVDAPFPRRQPSSMGASLVGAGLYKPKSLSFDDITAEADDSDEAAPVYG